mgnify:FL=1|jgi:hypothetical protein
MGEQRTDTQSQSRAGETRKNPFYTRNALKQSRGRLDTVGARDQ